MTRKTTFEKPELSASIEELTKALYESNKKLNDANAKLKKQEKDRLEFYANISHDLRAPITALSNSVEYLLASKETLTMEELADTLMLMQRRTTYINYLINDIFLLSSLESSDNKVHKELVDVGFFLEDYFYMCEADSKYDNTILELDIPQELNFSLMMDPMLFQRVLDNLFSNALKYSKDNPHIILGAYKKEDHLLITVEDNGIGIAKKHIDRIFDRSYMISKSRTPSSTTSSGFGLSIVKSIIEHHNGTIHCESELGKGSKFIIDLLL